MKTAILYCSKYRQHTKLIAEVMAKEIHADLYPIKDASSLDIREYDLIGFGSGVYQEDLSSSLIGWVDQKDFEGKKVFVFSTSGMGWKLYNRTLIQLLQAKKANIVGNFAAKGSFTSRDFTKTRMFDVFAFFAKNHPNDLDKKKARQFSNRIIKELEKA